MGSDYLPSIVHDAGSDAKALAFIVFARLGFGLNVASATILTSVEVPIIDYGEFHRHPPKSVKLPRANQTQHPLGHYSTIENSQGQPGYLHLDRLPEYQIQRIAPKASDAIRTGHTRSQRSAAFVGAAQCSASSLLGSFPQQQSGCSGGIRGGHLGGPRRISSWADQKKARVQEEITSRSGQYKASRRGSALRT